MAQQLNVARIAIIGAGPSGLAAAKYIARREMLFTQITNIVTTDIF
jgi:ribulose 1,5-bisphosphate synthetase/thiazole synthase